MKLGICSCTNGISEPTRAGGGVTPTFKDSGGKALGGGPECLQLVSRTVPGELILHFGSPFKSGEDRGPTGTEGSSRLRADQGLAVSTANSDKLNSGAPSRVREA